MATIRDNLGYIAHRLGAELASRRERFAEAMEEVVKSRISEGLGTTSHHPTWYNVTRIPRYRARFDRHRRAVQPRRRSSFGYASIWLEQGYAEYKGIIRGTGIHNTIDFNLTGHLLANLHGRAQVMAKNEGLHAWLGFRRQKRPYGKKTNRELADILNEKYGNPFYLRPEEAEAIFNEIIQGSLRASGAD